MKTAEYKCRCGFDSTGSTAVWCCNLCGLPLLAEQFWVNSEVSELIHKDEIKKLIDGMIEQIELKINIYVDNDIIYPLLEAQKQSFIELKTKLGLE